VSEQTPLAPAELRREQTAPARVRIPQQRSPQDQPAQQAAKDRRRLPLLPLGLAGVALLGSLGVGAALLDQQATTSTHQIRTPAMAGGLLRDPQEESALAGRLAEAESRFRAQFSDRLSDFGSVVYSQPDAGAGRPAGPLVFLGAAIDTKGDPGDFVAAFRSGAQGYRVTEVDAGPGARGVCAQTPTGVPRTYCAWSTGDSVGELLPTVAGWDTPRLAALMRDMRADVEHPM
jgi:hypothetical protein